MTEDSTARGTAELRFTRRVSRELVRHVPFTFLGTATGIVIMLVMYVAAVPDAVSYWCFWTLHPLHVLLSALVTTAMYRLYGGRGWWRVILIGYLGSIGIATLSDSVIPFLGEWLLDLPRRAMHLGFIEKWWLINPLALVGTLIAVAWQHTRVSHATHVLLSTWASLFHITMALGDRSIVSVLPVVVVFVFLAVWLPCCTSDIVFPLVFARTRSS